ncbi:MAG: protein-L-isoaspartate(D-aspartate) O-methyltransferase [Phycisphaerales bacterium]|nr:MAG: protein-L-isoaspartate(D-aspartate) O-methyltransferase [Phycisphaerales bacterium]
MKYSTSTKQLVRWLIILLVLVVSVAVVRRLKTATDAGPAFATEGGQAESEKSAKKDQDGSKESKPPRPDHKHPAFKERVAERARMVRRQIQTRGVHDPNVLKAMRIVPRHAFVRAEELRYAYNDHPLPIGLGQTISQPYIVASMTESLKLKPDAKVLEIGTGSGYQAAVCAEISKEVYTIEIVEELAKTAKERLEKLGYKNVFTRAGDGFFGWKEKAPFDAIIGTAAAGRIPPPLLEQLKPGGRMILPQGNAWTLQYLVLVTKDEKGKIQRRRVMPVRFVPMTGEVQKPEKK